MKRISLIFFSILYLLFLPSVVFAIDSPTQTNPVNGSTVSSTNVQWQLPSYTLYSGDHYRVQVDEDQSFSSINKDSSPTNNSYTPTGLSDGTWYWRVKAKDSTGTWSDWSSVWSYILSSITPTPTDSPTPTLISTPSPTSNNNANINISNIQSSINVDQSFDVTITITNFSPNSNYYLKGVFIKSDGNNYFGQTLVSGSWIKNSETYSKQFPITTDASGNWSGAVSAKGDQSDSGFLGENDYTFKIGYYKNEDSPSVSWSNEATIHLTGSVITETPSPAATKTSIPTKTPIPTAKLTVKPSATPTKNESNSSNIPPSILGTSSAQVSPTTTQDQNNQNSDHPLTKMFFIGGGLIILLSGGLSYTFIAKNRFN